MLSTRDMIAVSIFAALTAIFAQVKIPLPFTPVPITFQVLAVCLTAAILGSRLGTLSQLIYVTLGAVGIPVFAGGSSGLHVITGTSGGYILGFIAAAFVIGSMVERKPPTLLSTSAAMFSGLVVIYLFGMLQLSFVARLSLPAAFMAGVAPFIWLDLVKIALGAYLAYSVRTVLLKQGLISLR